MNADKEIWIVRIGGDKRRSPARAIAPRPSAVESVRFPFLASLRLCGFA
jgi:hypothetical protein